MRFRTLALFVPKLCFWERRPIENLEQFYKKNEVLVMRFGDFS